MGCLFKGLALVLILIVAFSSLSLLILRPACAQSIPTPSVPQFNVKFVNASYGVTTTNLYTGANETQQVSNDSIEITIKNQLFGYSNNGLAENLFFNVRIKPHFGANWTEVYPLQNITSTFNYGTFSYAWYINPDSQAQSNSSYTTISFPVVPTDLYQATGYDIQRYYSIPESEEGEYSAFLYAIPAEGQLDFQVETLVGHNSLMWVIEHPFTPTIGGHSAPAIAYDSTSGWSNAQTVTIFTGSTPNNSIPPVPEFPLNALFSVLLAMALVCAITMRSRKQEQPYFNA